MTVNPEIIEDITSAITQIKGSIGVEEGKPNVYVFYAPNPTIRKLFLDTFFYGDEELARQNGYVVELPSADKLRYGDLDWMLVDEITCHDQEVSQKGTRVAQWKSEFNRHKRHKR